LNNYDQVRVLLRHLASMPSGLAQSSSIDATDELGDWRSMWTVVASRLLQILDAGDLAEFDRAFRTVGEALGVCEPIGRQIASAALFGDFTRRAIAAGFDRTRFVEWLVPTALFAAPSGRQRGRVLYFNNAKGRGKVLGADRTVYFLTFGMLRGDGFRSTAGGQLVEFTPQFGSFNGVEGWGAYDAARLSETDGTEFHAAG
jgi:cold shock CspA family protein